MWYSGRTKWLVLASDCRQAIIWVPSSSRGKEQGQSNTFEELWKVEKGRPTTRRAEVGIPANFALAALTSYSHLPVGSLIASLTMAEPSSSTSSQKTEPTLLPDGSNSSAPSKAQESLFVSSAPIPSHFTTIKGPNLEDRHDIHSLMDSYASVGFQATGVHKAIEIINKMRKWRLSDDPILETDPDDLMDMAVRQKVKATIFLGFTSNLISSGLREVILFLVKNKYIDCLVTTAGGIEEDLIKCLGQTYLGDFHLDGGELRKKGMNRIGNLLVPNDNYCKFEDWVVPILDKLKAEQDLTPDYDGRPKNSWSPSRVIERLGQEINDERSVLYWAAKNKIPVFCPALTDGSLGDMIYFHSYKNPGLVIDLVSDIRRLNDMSVDARKAGMVILGGGVCKHQIANAMLFRNGADFSVYINTGQEFDGSDSGARPDEAVSWGKIKSKERGGENVKVYCDATIIFPLIVKCTWGVQFEQEAKAKREQEERDAIVIQ